MSEAMIAALAAANRRRCCAARGGERKTGACAQEGPLGQVGTQQGIPSAAQQRPGPAMYAGPVVRKSKAGSVKNEEDPR